MLAESRMEIAHTHLDPSATPCQSTRRRKVKDFCLCACLSSFYPGWTLIPCFHGQGTGILPVRRKEFVPPPFRGSVDGRGCVKKLASAPRAEWVAVAMIKEFLADCVNDVWWTKGF